MRLIVAFLLFACMTAHAGVIQQNVRTFSKLGDPVLRGPVTISQGSGITLTQVGQNISITATGTSTGTTGYEPELFVLNGGISLLDDIDGVRRSEITKTISTIVMCLYNSGTSGSTGVRVRYGAALGSSVSIGLTATGGTACTSTTPAVPLSINDLQNVSVTGVANGAPEDLTIKLLYSN